jgi:DNA repair exonuclease SbcCD nuclease subunit
MFRFLHAADIHLDSPLHKLDYYEGAPVDELRQATRRALDNLVQTAIRENVSFVLISGDLYDGDWKDYNTGLYFVSQTSKLRDAGIPVYIVAGNHDAAGKISRALRFPESVHLFPSQKPATLRINNIEVAIHGQSFASPAIKKDLSAKYPPPCPALSTSACCTHALQVVRDTNLTPLAPWKDCDQKDTITGLWGMFISTKCLWMIR